MERRFDMSDFEQSLKDHADQFKMIPSKRVWNGVYNNLHPGSKWPSITVAIIFIFTLFTIGSLNNSPSHFKKLANSDIYFTKNISKIENKIRSNNQGSDKTERRINSSKSDLNNTPNRFTGENFNPHSGNTSVAKIAQSNISSEENNHQNVAKKYLTLNNPSVNNSSSRPDANSNFNDRKKTVNEQINEFSVFTQPNNDDAEFQPALANQTELFQEDLSIPVSFKIVSFPPAYSLYLTETYFNTTGEMISNEDVSNQGTSLKTKKLRKKKNNKIEWTFYINPTISTVSFFNRKTIEPSVAQSSIVVLSNQPSFKLIRNKRIGMETGAEMSFKLSRKFKFVTGFNFSYSGYTNVSNLVHPTFATLTLNDGHGGIYEKDYITHYGNGQSQDHISLPNYNLEASVPVGIQYNIWGNNKVKIDIASLLEPSVLLKNDAYMISSDGRYYVNDPSLVRKTNLEANFGTYITLIGKKIKWHLGPDVRYQLFSTYKNIYPAKEHLINYGIRIGISK